MLFVAVWTCATGTDAAESYIRHGGFGSKLISNALWARGFYIISILCETVSLWGIWCYGLPKGKDARLYLLALNC